LCGTQVVLCLGQILWPGGVRELERSDGCQGCVEQ